MYIVFEGIDTVGKSTQIERIAKNFPNAIVTKEPGGTPLGKKIRKIVLDEGGIQPRSEILLFLADRAEHIEEVILPNKDKMVISDRSLISGIAYGLEYFDYLKLELFNTFATDKIYPDLVIILKLDRHTLEERLSLKKHDNIEKRGVDYLLSIQDNLIEVTNNLCINSLIIDATSSIEKIHNTIMEKIDVETY